MRKRTSAIVAALLIAFAGSAFAQVSTTGTIQVVIADKDGGRLPGVTVSAEAADSVTKRTVVTDNTGTALLEALAPSSQYTVTIALPGFADQTRDQHPGPLRPDGVAQSDAASRRTHGSRAGGRQHPDRRREELDGRSGHHAAAHRVAADGPLLSELPAAGSRRHAGQPDLDRQPLVALGHELEGRPDRRQPRRLDRQRLLLRRHQRHRPGRRARSAPTSTPRSSRNRRSSPAASPPSTLARPV